MTTFLKRVKTRKEGKGEFNQHFDNVKSQLNAYITVKLCSCALLHVKEVIFV